MLISMVQAASIISVSRVVVPPPPPVDHVLPEGLFPQESRHHGLRFRVVPAHENMMTPIGQLSGVNLQ